MQWKWWQIIVAIIFVTNLLVLNFFVFSPSPKPPQYNPVPTPIDQCGPLCQKQIDTKIAEFKVNLPSPLPTQKPAPSTKSKIRSVSYLPIPGNGLTLSNEWTALSGTDFYFDTQDYPGLKEIYFEANAHLFNGNGIAFIRLYDATHSVWVTGSEVQTNQQKDTAIVSGRVLFGGGKNLIRVQVKSLTADTAVFTSGRLKIIVEN